MTLGLRLGLGGSGPIVSSGSAWPDASDTGPRVSSFIAVPGDATSGTGWTWDGAAVVVTASDAVIEGLDVAGTIYCPSSRANVTIRDNKASSTSVSVIQTDGDDTIIEYNEVRSADGHQMAGIQLEGDRAIVRYNDVGDCENLMLIGAGSVDHFIHHNYLHDSYAYNVPEDPHPDCIQFLADSGNGSVVEDNNVIAGIGATSCVHMTTIATLTLNHNRFIGGGYNVYIYLANGVTVTNNHLGTNDFGHMTENGGAGTPTVTGNVDAVTGAPISFP